ncbi:hypothetical protein FCM35_KLT03123 [Carex littledalei]|uniref:Uncharacterized protein n=1 Tax=Carex littledalei TaxID=544730 RepID=A0A833R4C2_9POAL|nr:hypothetical protein FCM35_KLT03123 [Carex littledalei]
MEVMTSDCCSFLLVSVIESSYANTEHIVPVFFSTRFKQYGDRYQIGEKSIVGTDCKGGILEQLQINDQVK